MTYFHVHSIDCNNFLDNCINNKIFYDIVEIDGPYRANIETWDVLSLSEYLDYYEGILNKVSKILKHGGLVYFFGFPENCAEIKVMVRQKNILEFKRWITWYKQWTVHSGRKTETILVFTNPFNENLTKKFREELKKQRESYGLSIVNVWDLIDGNTKIRNKIGGFLWFEKEHGAIPSQSEYSKIKSLFNLSDEFDKVYLAKQYTYKGITNVDYIVIPTGNSISISEDGRLRSKSKDLYTKLFKPYSDYHMKNSNTNASPSALILFGGSGNAGLSAMELGFNVDICENDKERYERMRPFIKL